MARVRADAVRPDEIRTGIGRLLNVLHDDSRAVSRDAPANRFAGIHPLDLPGRLGRNARVGVQVQPT